MRFPAELRREIAELGHRVEASGRGAANALVAEAAAAYGKSAATVWRWLREVRGGRRRTRRDSGDAKRAEDALAVLTVKEQTRFGDARLGREWIGSTEKAAEVALAEGRIARPISAGTVNRFARRRRTTSTRWTPAAARCCGWLAAPRTARSWWA